MGILNLKNTKGGYLMFYVLLIGMISISHVSPNKNLDWAPDFIQLSPGPVIVVNPSKEVKDCGNVSTEDCVKKLQTFLRLKSLPYTSDEHKLNKLCSDTVAGYNCSSRKLIGPDCLSSKDKDTIPVFIEMAQYAMFMFCSSGDGEHGYLREVRLQGPQKNSITLLSINPNAMVEKTANREKNIPIDLLQYSECILKEKKALDCCAEGSKLVDLPVMHFLDQSSRSLAERQIAACCPVANYLKCAQTVILDKCGQIAGNLTTEYIRRASGEQMDSVCQKFPDYPEPNEEMCKSSPPVCAGSGSESGSSRVEMLSGITVLMFLLYSVLMIRA